MGRRRNPEAVKRRSKKRQLLKKNKRLLSNTEKVKQPSSSIGSELSENPDLPPFQDTEPSSSIDSELPQIPAIPPFQESLPSTKHSGCQRRYVLKPHPNKHSLKSKFINIRNIVLKNKLDPLVTGMKMLTSIKETESLLINAPEVYYDPYQKRKGF